MPSVFISYRHENTSHSGRVRALALRLRKAGLSVTLDALKHEEDWNKGGPPEGWLNWSYAQVAANDRVLIVPTVSYSRVYENKEAPGVGVGAAIEARRIFQQIADSKGINDKFRVVVLHAGDDNELPDQLKDYHRFYPNSKKSDAADLIQWLLSPLPAAAVPAQATAQVPAAPAAPAAFPDYPAAPVSIDRKGFVDCNDAFAAFEAMLTEALGKRILQVHGYGNQGKSTLLNLLYHHCRSLLGAKSVARLEFKKGGPTPEEHLRGVARALGVPAPDTGNLDDRVHAILDACTLRPAVILFDAYEHAELQHRHWVNLVLERTLDDKSLRCVVSGRELPPSTQLWAPLSCTVECDALKYPDAIAEHAIALGYKGKPEDVTVMVATFQRMRDRAIKGGTFDHSISSQAALEELQNICAGGGTLA